MHSVLFPVSLLPLSIFLTHTLSLFPSLHQSVSLPISPSHFSYLSLPFPLSVSLPISLYLSLSLAISISLSPSLSLSLPLSLLLSLCLSFSPWVNLLFSTQLSWHMGVWRWRQQNNTHTHTHINTYADNSLCASDVSKCLIQVITHKLTYTQTHTHIQYNTLASTVASYHPS